MKIIKNYFAIVYLISMISIIILKIVFHFLDFEITSNNIYISLYLIYIFISILGIYSVYKSDKKKQINNILYILPIILVFIPNPILRIISFLSLFPLFKAKLYPEQRIIYFISFSFSFSFTVIGLILGSWGAINKLETIDSPDGNYQLISVDVDLGATGGSTSVEIKRNYKGIAKWHYKSLYVGPWGEQPIIKWINCRTVYINGKSMDIFNDETWDTRRKFE